ncbi:MAG: hypothetical protein ACREO5_15225 [Candidatus Binatia bacterium]
MSEVLVEEKVCNACGVGVRSDTQFCYNCGESLTEETSSAVTDAGSEADVIPNITSKDSSPELSSRNGDKTPDVDREPLQSAASLRRKSKSAERKPVEVIWVPAAGTNVPLIIGTILLVLFSAAVVVLALYYR